jgi:hypothetical protein
MYMLPHEVFQKSPRQKFGTLILMLFGVALLGVIVAFQVGSRDFGGATTPTREGQPILIDHIAIGALVYEEEANHRNPTMREKMSYTTADQIVLRVTTSPEVIRPVELNARLLTPEGRVVELNPSSVSFEPGTSSFCCWRVDTPDEYTLQIFRPERTITTYPLPVIRAAETPRR